MEKDKAHKKTTNPYKNSKFLDYTYFGWTSELFEKGRKRNLEFSDLYETLSQHSSAKLNSDFSRAWDEELSSKSPSLFKVIYRCYGRQLIIIFFIAMFLECFLKLLQPIFIGKFILYYEPNQNHTTENDLHGYTIGIIICTLLPLCISHLVALWITHLCMKYRVGYCSLIYRKALKLSKNALTKTSIGQIVNLISNDLGRFDYFTILTNFLILGPLQAVIVSILIWWKIGAAAFVGMAILFMMIPLQIWLGLLIKNEKSKGAVLTDKRLRLMNEIFNGIKVIKMHTWEKAFVKLSKFARLNEISKIRHVSYIRGIVMSFGIYNTRLAMFSSFLIYVLTGNAITAEKVFVVATFYGYIKQSLCVLFPQAITMTSEIRVVLNRVQAFLLCEECNTTDYYSKLAISNQIDFESDEENETQVPFIGSTGVKSMTIRWSPSVISNKDDESDGEKDVETVNLPSFSSEHNFALSVKNISMSWDTNRSNPILSNITFDIESGSLVAIIGEVGSGKSSLFFSLLNEVPVTEGSYKINGKISYASQNPWIFNSSIRQNILFGSDMNIKRYNEVTFSCALNDDLKRFPDGDEKLTGDRGSTLSGGQQARINLARSVYREADIYLLDDPLSSVDSRCANQIFNECILKFLNRKTRLLITNNYQYLNRVDHIIMISDGMITAEGSYDSLKDNPEFKSLLSSKTNNIDDDQDDVYKDEELNLKKENNEDNKISEEVQKSGSVNSSVHKAYISSSGPWILIPILLLALVSTQALSSGSDYWMSIWVKHEEFMITNKKLITNHQETNNTEEFPNLLLADDNTLDINLYVTIYGGLVGSLVIFCILRALMFFWMCLKASTKLHNKMLKCIINANMRFFYITPIGRIINRFSKDIGIIDDTVPVVIFDCIQIWLQLAGILILITVVKVWFIFLVLLLISTFISLRGRYVSTARSLKRLEGIARSPMYSHLTASLQGLTTIRVFGVQKTLMKEFDRHQDLHSSVWFMILGTTRAFGFWLDAASGCFVTILVLSCVIFKGYFTSSEVGLILTQSLALVGMIQWGIRQSAELETLMTSVERVLEYHDVDQELHQYTCKDESIAKEWPVSGRVDFEKVDFKYFPNGRVILKKLSFHVGAQEKIGIVGRSGSGKSSIINAILRMGYTDGSIEIDNININNIGLVLLRKNISVIPQEPVLFSGTLRYNLDPYKEHDDKVIWEALEKVELKEVVSDIKDGLNSEILEGGSNFSVGQRQLICLARAIVRRNRILILDEATANVDPKTDSLIQKTIREEFYDYTVITIAHRLETIIESDKILVIENGKMVEYDHPYLLLQKENGKFSNMVKQSKIDTDHFVDRAKKNFEKKTVNS